VFVNTPDLGYGYLQAYRTHAFRAGKVLPPWLGPHTWHDTCLHSSVRFVRFGECLKMTHAWVTTHPCSWVTNDRQLAAVWNSYTCCTICHCTVSVQQKRNDISTIQARHPNQPTIVQLLNTHAFPLSSHTLTLRYPQFQPSTVQ